MSTRSIRLAIIHPRHPIKRSGYQRFNPAPRKAAYSPRLRWVPWELGIADGVKLPAHIALFPASDSRYEQSWASWEYLGLYDRIVWGKLNGYDGDVWMVLDEKSNTATELGKWLRGY